MLPSAKPELCVASHALRREKFSDMLTSMKPICHVKDVHFSLRKCGFLKCVGLALFVKDTHLTSSVVGNPKCRSCLSLINCFPAHLIWFNILKTILLALPVISLSPSLFHFFILSFPSSSLLLSFLFFLLSSLLLGYFQLVDFFWLGSWLPKYTDFAATRVNIMIKLTSLLVLSTPLAASKAASSSPPLPSSTGCRPAWKHHSSTYHNLAKSFWS